MSSQDNCQTNNFDYKKYSLEQLENWVHDAVSSAETSPQEIYDVIKDVVKEQYYYHKDRTSRAGELLALLNGNGKDHLSCDKNDPSPECQKHWNDFWEESNPTGENYSKHYYDYTRNDPNRKNPFKKVKRWILPVEEVKDEDTDEIEYCITFPDDLLEASDLKEGDEIEWIDQSDGSYLLKKVGKVSTYNEMVNAGYTMTDDGFWIKESVKMDEC